MNNGGYIMVDIPPIDYDNDTGVGQLSLPVEIANTLRDASERGKRIYVNLHIRLSNTLEDVYKNVLLTPTFTGVIGATGVFSLTGSVLSWGALKTYYVITDLGDIFFTDDYNKP